MAEQADLDEHGIEQFEFQDYVIKNWYKAEDDPDVVNQPIGLNWMNDWRGY